LSELGKVLVILGLAIAAIGVLLWSGIGRGWLGQLPGDLRFSRGHFSFYFPLATCILISLVITILLWLFRK
jgi:hypothetical protein